MLVAVRHSARKYFKRPRSCFVTECLSVLVRKNISAPEGRENFLLQ